MESKIQEIQELLEKDIIEPVLTPTEWISPVVVVSKANDDIRMCADMRRANEAILKERHPIPTDDELIQGIVGSKDIFVHAPTPEEHDKRLKLTLQRLQEESRTLNTEKCSFRMKQLEFLGLKLTADGINPEKDKAEAIVNVREPETESEMRSFLGLVNYCSRFISNYATIMEPLCRLNKKHLHFVFGKEQKEAF